MDSFDKPSVAARDKTVLRAFNKYKEQQSVCIVERIFSTKEAIASSKELFKDTALMICLKANKIEFSLPSIVLTSIFFSYALYSEQFGALTMLFEKTLLTPFCKHLA